MILLIDDDPSFACDMATLLEPRSEFIWTNRSATGLALIREMRPEHILVDLDLPHDLAPLDEDEGIAAVSRMSPEERTRVVVVTGSLPRRGRERLDALGVGRIHLKSDPVARLRRMLAV
jgi:ActR/RegA family two-component response regulator